MGLFRRRSPRPSLWDDPALRAARLAERNAVAEWSAALADYRHADRLFGPAAVDEELRLVIAGTRAVDAMNQSTRVLLLRLDPTSRESLDRFGI